MNASQQPLFIAGVIVVVALGAVIVHKYRQGDPVPKHDQIVLSLRVIDGAKQTFAQEHHAPAGTIVSVDELRIYGYRPDKLDPRASFSVNPLGKSPEAVLLAKVGSLPPGTVFRVESGGKLQVQTPDGRVE
jgi:hypothetical protein